MAKTASHLNQHRGGGAVVRQSSMPGSNIVSGQNMGVLTGGIGNDGSSSENLVRGRTGEGQPRGKGQAVTQGYIPYEDGVGSQGQGNYPAGDRSPNIVKGRDVNRSGSDSGGNY